MSTIILSYVDIFVISNHVTAMSYQYHSYPDIYHQYNGLSLHYHVIISHYNI